MLKSLCNISLVLSDAHTHTRAHIHSAGVSQVSCSSQDSLFKAFISSVFYSHTVSCCHSSRLTDSFKRKFTGSGVKTERKMVKRAADEESLFDFTTHSLKSK